ncbi:MAG: hypothetical protein WBV94_12605 [Blastocatellia bacterium]
MTWRWYKEDHFGLVYFVSREARNILMPDLNILDLIQSENGNREIVKIIYNTLLEKRVQYALEPGRSTKIAQEIRNPSEVLKTHKEGTCLDLSLLFCGICLGCELLPVLILLEDHALVAVSLKYSQYSWNRPPPIGKEANIFSSLIVDVEKAAEIGELISTGAYLALECTGFAQSKSLSGPTPEAIGREIDGTMTFERAVQAGHEHFLNLGNRSFRKAIFIDTAHSYMGLDPVPDSSHTARPFSFHAGGTQRTGSSEDPLPYLLDRSKQVKELKEAILKHRVEMPLRPLVCIIHGKENECHGEFINRLKTSSLPRILEFWYQKERKPILIPKERMELAMKSLTDANWKQVFKEELAAQTIGDETASLEDVADYISSQKLALMIDVPVLSGKLNGVKLEKLNLFFEFWNGWVNLPKDLLLIVCLSFKYERCYERKWFKGLNDRLRQYLVDLNYGDYKNLQIAKLSELEAISRADAEAAVNHKLVTGLTDSDVMRIYTKKASWRAQKKCIPMDDLLWEFREIRKEKGLG